MAPLVRRDVADATRVGARDTLLVKELSCYPETRYEREYGRTDDVTRVATPRLGWRHGSLRPGGEQVRRSQGARRLITVGIDLAAADVRTAIATIVWAPGTATVTDVTVGVDDDRIVGAVKGADKAGMDSPLGWPAPFVALVTGAAPAVHAPGAGADWRRRLAWRETDLVVRDTERLVPLSVSADRIAHVAFRCAALLARLEAAGGKVDRAGDGVVVEVYPAAALKRWGLPHRGLKGSGGGPVPIVDGLRAAAPWLHLGRHEATMRRSHDAADAIVAALAARAAAIGKATTPDPAQRARAATEGWIAVPTCSLDRLIE